MTAERWAVELRGMVEHVRADPPWIGVLSMGEQCAVALVLDTESLEFTDNNGRVVVFDPRPRGFTFLDCVNRIEPELLRACLIVQREGAP